MNAFSRYENGKAKLVPAVINLFRLLDKPPELIGEIAGLAQSVPDCLLTPNNLGVIVLYAY